MAGRRIVMTRRINPLPSEAPQLLPRRYRRASSGMSARPIITVDLFDGLSDRQIDPVGHRKALPGH